MATKKGRKSRTAAPAASASKLSCVCGSCHEGSNPRLGGYLLVALGALLLPLNMGLIPGASLGSAWPLAFVLLGVVLVAKGTICQMKSK